jgi:hypothetical protein
MRKTNSRSLGLWRCLQLSLANKNIILIEKTRMQNRVTIIVSLQEGQEGLNNARRAVGLRNHMGLTDGKIAVGEAEEVILNSNRQYRWNRSRRANKQR